MYTDGCRLPHVLRVNGDLVSAVLPIQEPFPEGPFVRFLIHHDAGFYQGATELFDMGNLFRCTAQRDGHFATQISIGHSAPVLSGNTGEEPVSLDVLLQLIDVDSFRKVDGLWVRTSWGYLDYQRRGPFGIGSVVMGPYLDVSVADLVSHSYYGHEANPFFVEFFEHAYRNLS